MTGHEIGPYRLDAELGSGGMGTVWRAEGADGAVVALKVVHDHVAATPGFLERFLREGEVGKSVRHENVVATLATGEDRGANGVRHWIALEYVEGQTLRGLFESLGTVPEELCRHVGREIAKGLGAIHAAGLLHRDVKPENVIISRCTAPGHDHVAERPGAQRRVGEGNVPLPCDHVVKVMDLGIARGADDEQRMTQTGMFVGSVQYAAPEQFTGGGKGLDARTDLHALGVTLYELATGVQPFLGDDVSETLRNVLHVVPRRAGDVNPQLSAFFEEVLRTLLEKEREKRFASAAELLDVLTQGEDSAWWEERARAIRAATRKPLRRIRIPRETALYGREAELAKLRAAYDRAAAGEGAVLLVEGEAGIGKSRLVDEFVGGLAQSGEDVNFLFGGYPPGGAATASGAFSTAWREHFGADEDALRAALPEQPLLVPAFAALLRGDAPPPGAEPLTKDSLQTVFVRSAQSLAKERVTIVLVEDLHFAPEEGRALFASLAMATPGHRILLVGTTRPGLDEKWTANVLRVGAEKVLVPRLGPADLVKLLADSLRSEHLATDLAGQIALKSDGNPFFVFEILRGLREGLFLTRKADGTWATTKRIEDIQIPPSIAELIQARVSDLGDDDRNLLEVAACVGFEFDPGLVGAVLGLAPIPTLQRLGAIEKRTRLVRASGKRFVFDHHQGHEHLYAGISGALREQYHAAIGEALEARSGAAGREPSSLDGALCADLCEQFLNGGRHDQARRYLDAGMAGLERSYQSGRAIELAERALAASGLLAGEDRAHVLLRIGGASRLLDQLGRTDRQESAAREVERIASDMDDETLRGHALQALGWCLMRSVRHAEAAGCMERAMAILRSCGDSRGEAAAAGNLGFLLGMQGRTAEARTLIERRLQQSCAIEDRQGEANALDTLATLCKDEGRLVEARALYQRALAIYRSLDCRLGEAVTYGNLGVVAHEEGRPTEASEFYGRSLEISVAIGFRRGEAVTRGNIAGVLSSEGRHGEALRQVERCVQTHREMGNRPSEAVALVNLGSCWLSLGERTQARVALALALAISRELGLLPVQVQALRGLGLLDDEEGLHDGARRRLEEAASILRTMRHDGVLAEVLLLLAEVRRRAGDSAAAATALRDALQLQREQNRAPGVVHCLALAACLHEDAVARAVSALADAGDDGDTQESRLLLWQATRDRAHLVEAKRLLDDLLAKNPPEYHEGMRTRVRVNREILEACAAEGIA